jgi:hypothetical protein
MKAKVPRRDVQRLRKFIKAQYNVSEDLYNFPQKLTDDSLRWLPNVDHRKRSMEASPSCFSYFGGRARLLTTKNGNKLVIKRIHDSHNARKYLKELKHHVEEHNEIYKDETRYRLLMPQVYVVGELYLLMRFLSKPSLAEIFDQETARGKKTFKDLKRKNLLESFTKITDSLFSRVIFENRNILYLGFKDGKHEFIPLADII